MSLYVTIRQAYFIQSSWWCISTPFFFLPEEQDLFKEAAQAALPDSEDEEEDQGKFAADEEEQEGESEDAEAAMPEVTRPVAKLAGRVSLIDRLGLWCSFGCFTLSKRQADSLSSQTDSLSRVEMHEYHEHWFDQHLAGNAVRLLESLQLQRLHSSGADIAWYQISCMCC